MYNLKSNSNRINTNEVLKKGGNFVCKIFDTFTLFTLKIMYLVKLHFEEFMIYKPHTSRVLNSEKYMVAKGFRGVNSERLVDLIKLLKDFSTSDDMLTVDLKGIQLNNSFIHEMSKMTIKFGEHQLYYLQKALEYARLIVAKKKMHNTQLEQIKLATEWCVTNGVEINKTSRYLHEQTNNE